MKRFIPLLALFAAGAAASFALASPPGKGGPTTGSATTHGNSGNHSQSKCHPVNLKGTVTGGTISLAVTKAAGKNAQQLVGTTASLKVDGKVSVQAWSCAASSTGSAPTTQTLFLKQLHVGGSPQNLGSTTTTTSSP
jgi:hypothetical protein